MIHTNLKIRRIFRFLLFIVIVAGIGTFAYSGTKNYFAGPIISIHSPENGSSFDDPLIEIRGVSKNISHLSLNGRKIFTNTEGEWNEKTLLFPGHNLVTIEAEDRFGRSVRETLEYIFLSNKNS